MLHTPLFNAESHAYTEPDGKPLVGVTSALSGARIINTDWFTEEGSWRGSVVHKCCEYWNRGTLKESSIDPAALGYVDSWREWCHRYGFKAKRVEQPTYHEVLKYAGTPDVDDDDTDVDYKTGSDAAWHAIQLALYSNFHPNARARRRFVVRLRPDGKPYTKEYTKDFAANLGIGISAVNIAHWKRTHGS